MFEMAQGKMNILRRAFEESATSSWNIYNPRFWIPASVFDQMQIYS